VLIGNPAAIRQNLNDMDEATYDVIDPSSNDYVDRLVGVMQRNRSHDVQSDDKCRGALQNPFTLATMLVEAGICDGMVAGSDLPYGEMVRPILTYGSKRAGVSRIAGMHLLTVKDRPLFFADTALIVDPSAEELAEIAMRASRVVKRLNITPRVAFVSYANFSKREDTDIAKLRRAYKIVRTVDPELECWRDVQADVALDPDRFRDVFGGQLHSKPANILIFPNLQAANAAYRVARVIGDGTAFGPMLLGLRRPCNVLPRGSTEEELMNMMVITAYNAQRRKAEIEDGKKTQIWKG
ncbi:MAG: hypothetical protein KDB07_04300, partial [Planctomycetes bacterium]|nr:hypothetical protein [Planctomycetota bacterium]